MHTLWMAVAFLGAYLLGAIPTSVWLGKVLYGIDVRTYGSGNAGATNTLRVLGRKVGIVVLVIDMTKGYVAASLPFWVAAFHHASTHPTSFQLIAGLLAIIGHIFPVYAGFKGGKGIATLFGVMLAIMPKIALICAGIFLLILFLTQYVSLSSLLAAVAFPLLIMMLFDPDLLLRLLAVGITLIVLWTHQDNIKRLFNSKEHKINLFGKKKDDD